MFFMRRSSHLVQGLLIGMAVGAAGTALSMSLADDKNRRKMGKMLCQAKNSLCRTLSDWM